MKRLLISATIAATLTLGACSSMPGQSSSASYSDMIKEAKTAHAQAAKAGNVWKQKKMKKPYVDHYIALAEKAKAKGDQKGALKNAQLALRTAKAELKQTVDYANVTPLWQKK